MARPAAGQTPLPCHVLPGNDILPGPSACSAMKTSSLLRLWACPLLVAGTVLISCPAPAKERFRIPPPPSPEKVIRDIRGFFHRVAGGVKNAGKKTWNAIRDPFVDDEDERSAPPQGAKRSKTDTMDQAGASSFARSKEAVPYPHDDADSFDARTKPDAAGPAPESMPQVTVTPRKSGPGEPATPSGQTKPAEPTTRRPFMSPEQQPQPPVTETPATTPKATPPGVDPNLEFARPVPGKRGLVYPPGAKETQENMVDVGDFKTGQIVRDPRTGKLFRVP